MAKLLMKSGRFHPFQLTTLFILAVSVCSENVFDADFSLIPRLGGAVRTTMSTAYGGFNSSLAIDGKVGNPNTCSCCSIANKQTAHAWLKIDLGKQYYVTGIKIYGRNDAAQNLGQSTDIDVFIGTRSLSHQTMSDPLISIQHGTGMYPYTKHSTTPWRFQVFLIRKRSADYLTICEVQFREDVNIINKVRQTIQTQMSTAYSENGKSFTADLAVDGDDRTNAGTCYCCSATDGSSAPWWQLDLGKKYLVSRIELIGTTHVPSQSENVDVYISNYTLVHGNSPITSNESLFSAVDNFSGSLFSTNKTAIFQFLMIRRWYPSVLTVCELKIYTQECDHGRYGEGCLHSCHCSNDTQCDTATGYCPSGCAPGYIGPTCKKDTNLVLGLKSIIETKMSTSYTAEGHLFTADLAVDGNAHTNAGTCSCCSATDGKSPPWWQLDLKRKYLVYRMELIGTTEIASQSQNVDVYVSNDTLLQGTSPIPNNDSLFSAVDNFSGSLFSTNKTAIFQFLMIRRWYQSVLTICEIKLYAQVCDVGSYGQNCTNSCGNCIQKPHCDPVDGSCTGGCEAGFQGAQCNIVCANGSYGQDCGLHCHCANGTACDTQNGSCPGGCDIGWSGPSCQKDDSLLSKINASSEVSHIWGGFNASLALDGLDDNLYTSFNNCKCCSVVDGEHPWWQVDLGAKYLVGAVYIVGRHTGSANQSKDISIIGSNDTATVNDITNTLFNVTTSALGTRFLHNFTVHPRMLKILRIQKRTNSILTICEVRLIEGSCRLGWFGDKCRYRCHCTDQEACNPVDGTCQSTLCSPGWSGSACDIVCGRGRFGQNCSGVAHCINGTANNNVNGTCIKGLCDPGWKGHACDTACGIGRFGQNCAGVAHCFDKTDNNRINGSCTEGVCDPGWREDACDKECGNGTFGQNCSGVAYCINGTANNNVNGTCIKGLCDPGWSGDACDKECENGTFGQNCSGVAHCFNKTDNNRINGSCFEGLCDPGWREDACDKECENGTFGQNCSCVAHCINGTANNNVNGTCIEGLCNPGWRRDACDKECKNGTFGQNCSGVGHCINGTANNNVNGACIEGLCNPGWRKDACDKECEEGRFGQNCSSVAHCINGTANNNVNGTCIEGLCDPGWRGDACDKVCESGRFGQNCSGVAHCINSTANNNVNGRCQVGVCEPGWKGHACDTECENGTFGHNCYGVAHCINNTANNNVNGSCIKGICDPGWRGYACDSVLSQTAGGGKPSSTLPAVGGVLGAAAIIAIIIVLVVFIKRKHLSKQKSDTDARFDVSNLQPVRQKPSSTRWKETNADGFDNKAIEEDEHAYYSFSPMKSAIKSSQLWHYIRKMQANKSKAFFDEFETLPDGLKLPCKEALRPENRPKNRYRDKYAYDHSRVVLKITGPSQTDYINASHIHGFERSQKFIASQGPTDKMLDDFWRMIWQQQSTTIVMLTNCMENGNKKCEKYWPDDDEVGAYGAVRVKVIATDMYADYYRREMEVSMADSPSRIVTQFHFKSWPDKDVPDSTWCLVNFWRAASRHPAPSDKAPIIVHCSAGIGRTGTYIALDYLYNQLQHEGSVQPLKAVQALRQQRVNMVQTRHQYAYLHEAVADAMGLGTHFIWASQFEDYFNYLTMVQPGSSKSPLEIQFDLAVRSIQDLQAEKAVGTGEDDVGLYANASIAAENAYRPATKKRGSKYVQEMGAMYLPGYTGAGVFLVANSPTEKSLVEFWSLVREENIKTVISLCESTAKNYKAASQLGVDSGLLKSTFDINALDLNRCSSYNERTYMFWENGQREEESRVTVRVFDYTAWKAGYNTPAEAGSLLELLEAVTSWQPHVSESQPILIHCNTGTRRSGVVCLLLSELQRIKREDGQVNLLDSLMVLMERCRGVIENAGQYQFCHDVIRRHLDQQQRHQQQDPGDQNIYANL